MAVGLGFDLHLWGQQGRLILAGIEIPYHKGLQAHSDGDVVLHSLIDAILGASGLGDIGELFPDTDKKWENASSSLLLKKVLEKVGQIEIVNIDVTVILDQPNLHNYKQLMRTNIAKLVGIDYNRVSIKAKTTEGVFPGGVSAFTVVQIV